jgi:hypothetical protein
MTITFDLPPDVEQLLRRESRDPNQAAKEATLVEFYRQGKITHHQFAQSLGISRLEADGVLKRHNVTEDLLTVEEFRRQVEDLERMAKK